MRILLRALAAVIVAGAATGAMDVPVAAGSEVASPARVQESTAPVRSPPELPRETGSTRSSTALPLTVSLICESFCEAFASGGSGSDTFTWTHATEGFHDDSYSSATVQCPGNTHRVVVGVTVTDASAATATASEIYYGC
jgi:hypothetical protein